jgi:hypothetical protein
VARCSSSTSAIANGFFGNRILLESALWSVIVGRLARNCATGC